MEEKCFKCGSTENVIIHHIKYEPEETVFCCRSCHKNIHNKVRKIGTCPLSIDETARRSRNSVRNRYEKTSMKRLFFHENVGLGWSIEEMLRYNEKTGNIYYWAGFILKK